MAYLVQQPEARPLFAPLHAGIGFAFEIADRTSNRYSEVAPPTVRSTSNVGRAILTQFDWIAHSQASVSSGCWTKDSSQALVLVSFRTLMIELFLCRGYSSTIGR